MSNEKLYPIVIQAWEKSDGICDYTGETMERGRNAALDHIIPKNRGGTNNLDNLHFVLVNVNNLKARMMENEFIDLCKKIVRHNA